MPDDEARFGGEEPRDRGRDLLGVAHAAQREAGRMSAIPEASIMSVTTRPGATALMRTPSGALSRAAERMRLMAAALEAE